jgi:hypothetical protein
MMRIVLVSFFFIYASVCSAQTLEAEFPKSFTVAIENKLNRSRYDVAIHIDESRIFKKSKSFNSRAFVVLYNNREVASQYNSNDSQMKGIVVVLDSITANEKSTLVIRYNPDQKLSKSRHYTKRTHAELSHKTGGKFVNREYIGGEFAGVKSLRVPAEHKDHSWFIRYEGPGWESDKVGYRFYLDQRNATDVFGKKTTEIVLPTVGLDGFDSYHEMQPWGMDILKVGPSLGLGSPGFVDNGKAIRVEKTDSVKCDITEDGTVYSSMATKYSGWKLPNGKINLTSLISISAGSRMSKQVLISDKVVDGLCTGIIKDKAAVLITDPGNDSRYAFMFTYGKQSLNKDELGLAVLVRQSDLKKFSSDEQNNLLEFKPSREVEYYYLAAWIGEPNGIRNKSEFKDYVVRVAEELASPIQVAVR